MLPVCYEKWNKWQEMNVKPTALFAGSCVMNLTSGRVSDNDSRARRQIIYKLTPLD